jgi:hypothetical protein
MTASREDIVLTSDLTALGDDSRREPVPFAESLRSLGVPGGVYRDDRPGAEARRDALAEQRRRELATMPLALSRVFVHRVSRAAGGVAALGCALTLALLIADPLLLRIASWLVPGLDLTLLAALSGVAVLGAYVVAGWIAERVFESRMAKAIATRGGDAYADLDHLAESPIDVARALVRRVDGWSIGLGVAGLTAVAAIYGYAAFMVTAMFPFDYAWSQPMLIGSHPIAASIGVVVGAIIIGVAAALWLGRNCDRSHGRAEPPAAIRWLGHWAMVPVGTVLGMVALYGSFRGLHAHVNAIQDIDSGQRLVLCVAGVASIFMLVAWGALWLRRRENARAAIDS